MSGGHWGYKQFQLEEQAVDMRIILEAVAKSEHIVDWAICGDTSSESAAKELFELWENTFEKLYGDDLDDPS